MIMEGRYLKSRKNTIKSLTMHYFKVANEETWQTAHWIDPTMMFIGFQLIWREFFFGLIENARKRAYSIAWLKKIVFYSTLLEHFQFLSMQQKRQRYAAWQTKWARLFFLLPSGTEFMAFAISKLAQQTTHSI